MFKLTVNNIELSIEPSTVKVKKEATSFKSSFEISKTTRPLVVLEDEACVKSLGAPNLFSSSNNVFTNVLVQDGNETFFGTLTVRDIIKGGRKCDVVYINALIPHLSNKIHTYFNDITVDGSEPTPYEDKSDTDINDIAWKGFVQDKISRPFPEVDFNFPSLKYPLKFGNDIQPEDEWFGYMGEINQKTIGSVTLNSFEETLVSYLSNKNVVVPFYYVQSPLYKVFKETLNYRIIGDYVTDTVQQKRLLFSKNNNLVATTVNDKTVYKHHLTIHPERYLPNWTVAEYLTALKNNYNLKIDIDHTTKTISLNYNEETYFNAIPLNISNYAINGFNLPSYNDISNYIIKDASENDFVKIYTDSTENSDIEDESTTVIQTKFKAVPDTLTQEWEELSGIGVLNYDYKVDDTYQLDRLQNDTGSYETNYIRGDEGLAKKRWFKWCPFRIKAKIIKPKMVCSLKQKNDIEKAKTLYLNGQTYLRKQHEFELFDHRYIITLELLTRN